MNTTTKRAILIDAQNKCFEEITIGDYKEIYKHGKFDLFTCVGIDDSQVIFVDDEGIINGTSYGFNYGGQILAGNGIVLGSVTPSGRSRSTTLTIEEVKKATKFIDFLV